MKTSWRDFVKSAAATAALAGTGGNDALASQINAAIGDAVEFGKKWESFSPQAYNNGVDDVYTIGHGLTRIPDPGTGKVRKVRQGDVISKEQSDKLMRRKYRENAYQMYKNYPWFRKLRPGTMRAALDLAYNGGWGIFNSANSPNFNRKMKEPGAVPDDVYWSEHDTYTRSGGKSNVKGLANRRADARKKWGPQGE